jgi:TonB family protein
VVNEVAPPYPAREFHNGIVAGRARLLLRVDPQGQLVDALVTGYTLPGFAESAMNAVKRWKFAAARVDGRPAFANVDVTFVFDVNKPLANAVYGPRDESPVALVNYQYGAVPASQLDHPLGPLNTVAPVYPADWAQRGIKGSVVVEFYVDETGRVRMPAIVSADRPELAWIAIPAVEQWRFPPPTRQGQPVLVKAQQAFQF